MTSGGFEGDFGDECAQVDGGMGRYAKRVQTAQVDVFDHLTMDKKCFEKNSS
jgi:hypothetical protein